jgi:hypothetical protein
MRRLRLAGLGAAHGYLRAKALAGTTLDVFPNPTSHGHLTLLLSGYTKAVRLSVLNAVEQVVYTRLLPAQSSGSVRQAIDLSQLPVGVYVLRVLSEDGSATRRLIRE